MKREIKRDLTEMRTLCDHCEKDCTGFSKNCWVCRAETCYQCCDLILFVTGDERLLDLLLKVCKRCQQGRSEWIEEIRSIAGSADMQIRKIFAQWKKEPQLEQD